MGWASVRRQAYVRALRMLCQFYHKTPDQISESELHASLPHASLPQQYFLHRKNRDGGSPSTLRICYCGLRFFFVHVLRRDGHTLDLIRAQSEQRLPAVLSVEEVRALLGGVHTPHHRAFLSTVYACGLRLQEAPFDTSGPGRSPISTAGA
jgi:site-specific recombinase XerD